MTGMPREVPKPRTGSGTSWGGLSKRLRLARERGLVLAAARGGTCFRGTHSASYTSFALMRSRSLRWPMVDAGLATGGRASDEAL